MPDLEILSSLRRLLRKKRGKMDKQLFGKNELFLSSYMLTNVFHKLAFLFMAYIYSFNLSHSEM